MKQALLARSILQVLGNSRSVGCPHHATDLGVRRVTKNSNGGPQETDYAFEMVSSTIRFGPGVTREVGFDLQNMGAKNTMVLVDPALVDAPPYKTVANSLTKLNQKFTVFDKIGIEPTDNSFQEAIAFGRQGGYDSFVALGGGSTMDTAKAASLYTANPQAEFLDFVQPPFGKQLDPPNPILPLIAIPTTAGTGSETTTVSIFDVTGKGFKTGIRHRAIKPHLAVVDPLNVTSMPRHVAIFSGFDVLCHALESFTVKSFNARCPRPSNPKTRPVYQGSNPISDVWAREALRIVSRYLRRCVNDPEDLEARTQMLLASSFAGMGFGNAGVHLCHGLSYPISGQVKNYTAPDYPTDHALVPHGLSVIMTACADFKFTCSACPDRHLEAAGLLGADTSSIKSSDAGVVLADLIKGYMSDFKVANGLKMLGFEMSDTPKLAENALNSISALQLCPRQQTVDILQGIYEDSMEVY